MSELSNQVLNYRLAQTLGQFIGSNHPEISGVSKEAVPVVTLNKEQVLYRKAVWIGAQMAPGALSYQINLIGAKGGTQQTVQGFNILNALHNPQDLSYMRIRRSFLFVAGDANTVQVQLKLGFNSAAPGGLASTELLLYEADFDLPAVGSTGVINFGEDASISPAFPSDGLVFNFLDYPAYILDRIFLNIIMDANTVLSGPLNVDFMPRILTPNKNQPNRIYTT